MSKTNLFMTLFCLENSVTPYCPLDKVQTYWDSVMTLLFPGIHPQPTMFFLDCATISLSSWTLTMLLPCLEQHLSNHHGNNLFLPLNSHLDLAYPDLVGGPHGPHRPQFFSTNHIVLWLPVPFLSTAQVLHSGNQRECPGTHSHSCTLSTKLSAWQVRDIQQIFVWEWTNKEWVTEWGRQKWWQTRPDWKK